jgi:hypothetical protein
MILFFENSVLFEVKFFKKSKFEADNIFEICNKEELQSFIEEEWNKLDQYISFDF